MTAARGRLVAAVTGGAAHHGGGAMLEAACEFGLQDGDGPRG